MTAAVLVNLTIGSFNNQRTDKEASQATAKLFNAQSDSGKYIRNRIPQVTLKQIHKLQREMRQVHYQMGSPWFDGGIRILPATLIMQYSKEYKRIDAEMQAEVDTIVDALPQMKQDFAKTQAGLFRLMDFPTEEEIRAAFRLEVEMLPMTTSDDFRIEFISDQVKSDYDSRNKDRLEQQTLHMVGHVRDLVGRLDANLQHDSPKIRESTVTKLEWFHRYSEDAFLDQDTAKVVKSILKPIKDVVIAEYDPDAKPKFNVLAIDEARHVVTKARQELDDVS